MANIQALAESVLLSSKQYKKNISLINYLLLIFAIISIYTFGITLYVISALVVLMQLSTWCMILKSEQKKETGQALIRHNLIEKGFNKEFPARLSYLKGELTNSENDSAKYLERDNYYSVPPDTDKRFLCMLKESCFWTSSLYQRCYKEKVISVVFMSLLFLTLLMSATIIEQPPDESFSLQRTFMVIIGMFPLWQNIKDSLNFNSAMTKLKEIDNALEGEPKSTPELLMLFSEYSVITSSTPLIPDEVYVKNKGKIQENWDIRVSNSN